jgi:hypothetical protein
VASKDEHIPGTFEHVKHETIPNQIIGHIYRDGWGWNSYPYAGDIGHALIDTREDAIADVRKIWREHHG